CYCHWLCLFHGCNHFGRVVGRRCLGYVLAMGPERNMGLNCLAKLCGLASYAANERPARGDGSLLGTRGLAYYQLCLLGREYVPVGLALIRRTINSARAGQVL